MANPEYRRYRKYDISFVQGSASGDQMTNHLNGRYAQLAEDVGGTPYFDVQNVTITYVNRANPTHFKTIKETDFTNETSSPLQVQSSHQRRYSNNYSDNIPASSQYLNSTVKAEETKEVERQADVQDEDIAQWMFFIEYDYVVKTASQKEIEWIVPSL